VIKFDSLGHCFPVSDLTAVTFGMVSLSFNRVSYVMLKQYYPREKEYFPARLGRSSRFVTPNLSMDGML